MAALDITTLTGANVASEVTLNAITVDQADTISIESGKSERFLVLINNSSTTAGTATVAAGIGSESAQGDLEITVPASGSVATTLETARFKDADGNIGVTVSTLTAGTIAGIQLP